MVTLPKTSSVEEPTPTAKTEAVKERHVLVIDDGSRRAIALDAAAYSIGRDSSNAIVLNSGTVSRKHAILLRLPIPGEQRYRYRLIDGDSEGKPSANGIFVNRQRCTSHELVNGDIISLGLKVQASYLTVSMEEAEFTKYLESIEFHRLKSDTVDAKATMVSSLYMDEPDSRPNSPPRSDHPTITPQYAPTIPDGQSPQGVAKLLQLPRKYPLPTLLFLLVVLSIPFTAYWFASGQKPSSQEQSWLQHQR